MYQFEWDAQKAAANYAKHGVTFEEAQTVFFNALAVILPMTDIRSVNGGN